jgi:hypothetical protein
MLGSVSAFAQIGIGTKTPAASAALEVSSSGNNKGVLITRLTAMQKDAIVSPAEGLLVYQTTATIGFYFYTGTAWKLMAIQTDVANKVDKVDGKDLSSNDYTTAEKIKLATLTGAVVQTNITGNAGTATKLAASKTINGVAFDGSSDITIATAASAETLAGTTLKSTVTASGLTSVGTLANLIVTNPIAGSVTGNAGTATKLAASKNINGIAFDGSSDITITAAAAAETLAGTTLKSTVTASGLTSVGTLANLIVTNPIAGSVTGNAENVRGLVAIANGGTNSAASATAGGIGYGTGTAHAYTGAGSTGQVLSSNGAGVPTWITPSGGGIPYTGATTEVNLGSFDLKVNDLTIGKGGSGIATNTAIGNSSLGLNTTGTANSAAGFESLKSNTTGAANTAFGAYALRENQNGERNTAFGSQALQSTNGAYDNTAVGYLSSVANASGRNNTAIGSNSSLSNTAGSDNTSVGYEALYLNQANGNTASGYQAMRQNIGGGRNTALGYTALYSNTTASFNVAVGAQALGGSTSGDINVAIGAGALDANITGSYNTVLGGFAGRYFAEGLSGTMDPGEGANGPHMNSKMDNSILIGAWTKPKANNETNQIVIGYNAIGNGSNTIQLGNTSVTNVKTSGTITAGGVTYPNIDGTAGQVLTANANGIPTWTSASSTVNASSISGIVAVANGGTGVTSSTGTGSVVLSNSPTFSGPITAKQYVVTSPTTISAAATTTIDLSTGNLFEVALGANISTLTLTNPSKGTYLIKLKQDNTGSRTVVFPTTSWLWAGGTIPTITTTANKTDFITIIFDGSTYYATAVQNF